MDKNKTVEAVSRFIPLLLWVLIIFFFSAQPSPYELVIHQFHPAATANTRTTADLTETQPPAIVKYKGISSIFPRTDDKQEILGRYLHVAEYAILSLLLARTLVWK